MKRNPLYAFRDRNSVGIYNIPLHSTVHIINSDGSGLPIFVEIEAKTGLSPTSTIGQFLDDPSLYINLSQSNAAASELEKITEGPLNNTGWALLNRDVNNYGDIGKDAIDLSYNASLSDVRGATGQNSFAAGVGTEASGISATAFGIGTIATQNFSTAIGKYNDNTVIYPSDVTLVVGVGSEATPKNGLVVLGTGQVIAPSLALVDLENGSPDLLVTKEYCDVIDGGFIV